VRERQRRKESVTRTNSDDSMDKTCVLGKWLWECEKRKRFNDNNSFLHLLGIK